jgi:hypothetical protein
MNKKAHGIVIMTMGTATIASIDTNNRVCNKKVVRLRVTKETADHLKLLAFDGEECWDDIIRRLIAHYEGDKNSILREAQHSVKNETYYNYKLKGSQSTGLACCKTLGWQG